MDAMKILGSLLGNNAVSSGLGSQLLSGLTGGGSAGGGAGGGLAGLLGGMLGGGGSAGAGGGSAGAGGGMLGGLAAAALSQFTQGQSGGAAQASPQLPPGMSAQQANDGATVLIRAMINAAKADGHVDEQEQQKIVKQLGDVSQDEAEFVRQELARPVDVAEFVRSVPRGSEQQVYAMSLVAINLDTNPEAQYLQQLAQGLNLSPQVCNQIHQQVGAQQIFS